VVVVTLSDIEAAAARIQGIIRETPVMPALPVNVGFADDYVLNLKLECLQVTGSFKARGASSKLTSLDDAAIARGLITASGGNHGLGVAYAAWRAGVPAKIYLPANSPKSKAEKITAWGAEAIYSGEVWDEANAEALRMADETGMSYVHAFADPMVIAGQGTLGLETLQQLPRTDTLLVAIGGGGFISGVSIAAKESNPKLKVIGIEPVGAPTLKESLAANRVITLDKIETKANTLAPRASEQVNFDIIRDYVEDIVLVDDGAMVDAARWLWFEFGIAAELSGAAAIAALMTDAYRPAPGENVVAIICGAGKDGLAD